MKKKASKVNDTAAAKTPKLISKKKKANQLPLQTLQKEESQLNLRVKLTRGVSEKQYKTIDHLPKRNPKITTPRVPNSARNSITNESEITKTNNNCGGTSWNIKRRPPSTQLSAR